MPSETEHNAQLVLQTGADARLKILIVSLALLCVVATAFNPIEPVIRVFMAVASAVVLIYLVLRFNVYDSAVLRISRHGHCRVEGAGRLAELEGVLERQAWLSRWYSLLQVGTSNRHEVLLISARRQQRDEYRKLQCWMRHRSFS